MSPELDRRTFVKLLAVGSAVSLVSGDKEAPRRELRYTTSAEVSTYLRDLYLNLDDNSAVKPRTTYPTNTVTLTTYMSDKTNRSITFTQENDAISRVLLSSTSERLTTEITFERFWGAWNISGTKHPEGDTNPNHAKTQTKTTLRLPEKDFNQIKEFCDEILDDFV